VRYYAHGEGFSAKDNARAGKSRGSLPGPAADRGELVMAFFLRYLVAVGAAGLFVGLMVWIGASFSMGDHRSGSAAPPGQTGRGTGSPDPQSDSGEGGDRSGSKVLSFAEAVRTAERLGKGQAVRAERRDKPEVHFKIEVQGWDGMTRRIELAADGTLRTGASGASERDYKPAEMKPEKPAQKPDKSDKPEKKPEEKPPKKPPPPKKPKPEPS